MTFGARLRTREGRATMAVGLALLAHVAVGTAVVRSPQPTPRALPALDRTAVRTFEADVRRPKLPEPAKPPKPPKPPDPPPEVPKPPPPTIVEALEPAAPAPKAAPRRVKPKTTEAQAATPKKVEPRTVRLENLGGTSNVKAYEGSSDSLGAPEERATPENDRPDPRPTGDGPPDSDGTAATGQGAGGDGTGAGARILATPPKVKLRVKGEYPPNAPRTGQSVALTLKLEIDEVGRVISAAVVARPPIAGSFFDAEAIRAVKATTFEPARRDGVAIRFSIRYVVKFEP